MDLAGREQKRRPRGITNKTGLTRTARYGLESPHRILSSAPFDSPAARLRRAAGSLMAGHCHVECPERAKRVEGPCLRSLSIASSSYALRLPVRCTDRSLYVGWTKRRRGTRRDAQRWTRRDLHEGPPPGNAGFSPRRTQPWRQRFSRERQIKHWSAAKKEALVAADSAALKRFAISHASPRSAGLKLSRNTCQKPVSRILRERSGVNGVNPVARQFRF